MWINAFILNRLCIVLLWLSRFCLDFFTFMIHLLRSLFNLFNFMLELQLINRFVLSQKFRSVVFFRLVAVLFFELCRSLRLLERRKWIFDFLLEQGFILKVICVANNHATRQIRFGRLFLLDTLWSLNWLGSWVWIVTSGAGNDQFLGWWVLGSSWRKYGAV